MKLSRAYQIAALIAVLSFGSQGYALSPSPLFLCLIHSGVPVGPTITIGPIISSDSINCISPFTRMGNLILIRAKADTATGFFVLDTGAPGLVLNITYFRHYPASAPTDGGGITGSTTASRTLVDSFRLGPVK